jgi:glyoxylase-like metal-dependent hydrolase (beta-lactamase superfamily II)
MNGRIHALALSMVLFAGAGARADTKLQLKVFTASPEGFWVDSTLISGAKDAILIDAQFTLSDAHRLVATILESKKNLTTVYITHWHPDHYFGLVVLRQAFPKARFVALPQTVADIKRTWKDKVQAWKPMYGDNIPSTPLIPDAMTGTTLSIEGEELEVIGPVQGDAETNSYVWIPSSKTVICGDIVYNGLYPWTVETNTAQRKQWIAVVDKIALLTPRVVVPGHKDPDMPNDNSSLDFTKDYLTTFDILLASAKDSQDLQTKVKAKFPGLGLDIILKLAADAAFKTAPTSK